MLNSYILVYFYAIVAFIAAVYFASNHERKARYAAEDDLEDALAQLARVELAKRVSDRDLIVANDQLKHATALDKAGLTEKLIQDNQRLQIEKKTLERELFKSLSRITELESDAAKIASNTVQTIDNGQIGGEPALEVLTTTVEAFSEIPPTVPGRPASHSQNSDVVDNASQLPRTDVLDVDLNPVHPDQLETSFDQEMSSYVDFSTDHPLVREYELTPVDVEISLNQTRDHSVFEHEGFEVDPYQ